MPNIKPVSDLRNYTEVLKEVDASNRVYLTRNGHGQYGILTMEEIDELDRYRAAYTLFSKLKSAEERADREGWISADDLEKELGVQNLKRLEYSPDAAQKLRNIKCDVTMNFGADVAKRVVSYMTKALRRLQKFEKSGISVEKTLGVPCDYLMVYTEHNYAFYKITEESIYIIDILHEREDFMWKLFGVRTTSKETEDYWDE